MLQRDGTGGERAGEREGTQVVSEQLHRVLFYLSSRTWRADGGACACANACVNVPGVSMAASPRYSVGTYYIHSTMTAMALDETGWTGWGKGGVKHLTDRRMNLSARLEISVELVDYELFCYKGYYYEFRPDFFLVILSF